ncbi:unnamed protein product [Callosobruchus maculatus]|uniref:Protein with SprT-like domain at the N terminus n=1 Tax=Callosobruchus maculatus TaxID=64391 RepID=A0A653C4X5_CALMS|nr:unnamed protein product [Callosobruchus maculatus]
MEKSKGITLCDPETLCPIKTKKNYPANYLNHPKWELLDPTPNIQKLFKDFNKKYFEGKIKGVAVVWGKLLDEAGVTIFRERVRRRDYDCRIVLSAPLLRLRPRADLINTLLHEMIHAFLFVTFNEKERAEHGPEFKKHMRRLNKDAGTAITIYHDFHDEVDLYTKQHWWRCNGPCQKWRPNFGLVRKMRNKPPGPSERWWKKHSRDCGGTFIKVRKPGDMDAKPVKMETTGAQKKTSPRPRNCRCKRRAGCSLAPEISDQKLRSTSPCPACNEIVHLDHLNEHLDQCLKTEACKDCIVCGSSIPLKDYETHVISCADKKFSDVQFKQSHGCSCSARDYEKQCSKCSNSTDEDVFKKCFICDCRIASEDYEKHIDKCTALTKSPTNPKMFKQNEEIVNCIVCGIQILKEELHIHLEECDGLLEIFENGEEAMEERSIYGDQCVCPICMNIVLIEDMNTHIDQCIEK